MDIFGKYSDLMAQGRPNGRPVGVRDGMGQPPRQVSSPALGGQVNAPGSIVGGPLPISRILPSGQASSLPGTPGPPDLAKLIGGIVGGPGSLGAGPIPGGPVGPMDFSKNSGSGWLPDAGMSGPAQGGQQGGLANYLQSLQGGFQGLGARAQANQARRAQQKSTRQANRQANRGVAPGRMYNGQGVL
jgi:hypothetical protein